MQDFVWSAFCRKLVQWREQSLEMCDLYSAAPNAFVLLRSCISFASFSLSLSLSFVSFFPFPLMLARSLPAAIHLVLLHRGQPTTVTLLLLAFFQLFLSFLLPLFCFYFPVSVSSLFCMCRCETALKLFYSGWIKQRLPESHPCPKELWWNWAN